MMMMILITTIMIIIDVDWVASPGWSERSVFFHRLSVAIQRFNSVLLHNGFTDDIPDL